MILKHKLNQQLNFVILQNFKYSEMFCKMLFFLHKFISRQFILNSYSNETKPAALIFFVNVFVSFVTLLSISLDEYNLFLSHVKQVFLMMIMCEQKYSVTILVLLSRMIINILFLKFDFPRL